MLDRIVALLRFGPGFKGQRDGNIYFDILDAKPADGTAGYGVQCIILDKTNGITYTNEGTAASCTFAQGESITAAQETALNLSVGVTAGAATASKAVILDVNSHVDAVKTAALSIGATGAEVAVTATPAELNQLDGAIIDDMAVTAGVGITGTADNFASMVEKIGTLFKTTIVIDIDGLNSGGANDDIIGADGAGVAHLGQITAARSGTIFAGTLRCIETPAGGDPDIDLHSATEATGVEDTAISALTETKLCNSGDLSAGSQIPLTAFPAANEYLYLTCGVFTDATYTAGILVIELWGV